MRKGYLFLIFLLKVILVTGYLFFQKTYYKNEYYYKNVYHMKINEKEAIELRDKLHNLGTTRYELDLYREKLHYIIAASEDYSPTIYENKEGDLIIGYDYNMDIKFLSEEEWNHIFKGTKSFNLAKQGLVGVTEEEARRLKTNKVDKISRELYQIFDPYWRGMRRNEKAILTEIYYHNKEFIQEGTNLFKYVIEYQKTSDEHYLELAVNEIRSNLDNAKNWLEKDRLKNINNIRAIIFDSRKCPLYSKPDDVLIPLNKRIEVIIGKTVISRETSAKFVKESEYCPYYIWRTRINGTLCPEHKNLEGKVFRYGDIDSPGEERNCTCYAERVPLNITIIELDENDGEN